MYGSRHQLGSGLMRYGSAPGSLLASLVDELSPGESENLIGKYFSGDSSCLTSESSCRVNVNVSPAKDLEEINAGSAPDNRFSGGDLKENRCGGEEGFQGNRFCEPEMVFGSQGSDSHMGNSSFCLNQMNVGDFSTASSLKNAGAGSLIRHSSSPAGFFKHVNVENGILVGGGVRNFSSKTSSGHGLSTKRLKSQMSFSRQESLPQLPEMSIPEVGESIAGGGSSPDDCDFGAGSISQSYLSNSFQMGSWEETNPIVFSSAGSKRARDINGEMVRGLTSADSQFSLPTTSLEMAAVENALQIQQEYVPCKLRARRGCATHPRSIAERERRTKISEKLRKLQELVPNMDKQTNTADMLDLAVQHIKILQNQVQKLNQDRANCTCSSKRAT